MTVKIIADSACDLPKEVTQALDIEIMPLMVYLDDVEYQDGIGLDYHTFFESMRNGGKTRTAQVPNPVFEETFKKYHEDQAIYIAFSSELSGTYQGSILVKTLLESQNLTVIDSRAASIGYGLIVYYAGQLAQQGASKEEIIKSINFHINHIEHIFTVNDLEYLYRGGRVTRGAAVLGTVLNIKPILHVEDGKLVALTKVRSRKKAINRMIELVEERGIDLSEQTIGINHGDDLQAAELMKSKLQEKFGCQKFIINYVGCAIGAHSGPGTLSVFFLNKTK